MRWLSVEIVNPLTNGVYPEREAEKHKSEEPILTREWGLHKSSMKIITRNKKATQNMQRSELEDKTFWIKAWNTKTELDMYNYHKSEGGTF